MEGSATKETKPDGQEVHIYFALVSLLFNLILYSKSDAEEVPLQKPTTYFETQSTLFNFPKFFSYCLFFFLKVQLIPIKIVYLLPFVKIGK